MPTILKIEQKVKDYSPIDPPQVVLVCSSRESAQKLRNALYWAGFATEYDPRTEAGLEVTVYQGDGTI